jgi:hypothetical protein
MTAVPGPAGVVRTLHQSSDLATTSVTAASIPGLAFQLYAGKTYNVEGTLLATATALGNDAGAAASATGGTVSGNWGWHVSGATNVLAGGKVLLADSAVAESPECDIADGTDVGVIKFYASITVSADDTVIQIQGNQGTAAGGTTTFADGWVKVSEAN